MASGVVVISIMEQRRNFDKRSPNSSLPLYCDGAVYVGEFAKLSTRDKNTTTGYLIFYVISPKTKAWSPYLHNVNMLYFAHIILDHNVLIFIKPLNTVKLVLRERSRDRKKCHLSVTTV